MNDFDVFFNDNLLLFAAAVTLVFLILYIEVRRFTKGYKEVAPDDAVKLLNRDKAVLLDVREVGERKSGYVKSSRHMPASTLADKIGTFREKKDVPLIAYCASGVSSGKACSLLTKTGFKEVYNLKGGFAAWQQAQLPIVRGKHD